MSRGSGEGRRFSALGWGDISLRILVPAAAALSLLAIVTEQGHGIDHDLHVVASDEVAAGELLPVRVQLYAQLRRPEGAVLITPKVVVELRAAGVHAQTTLQRSHRQTLEGVLPIPSSARGEARLYARATQAAEQVSSERTLRVVARPKMLPLLERELPPLRRFAAANVVVLDASQTPPNKLQAQVAGGACVPEARCELLVHVGEPAAALAITPSASVTPEPQSAQPGAETSGVARLQFVTHGPEAQLTLTVSRAGKLIATRALRLPVALGVDAVLDTPSVVAQGAALRLGLSGSERGCIVDAFRDQRWLRTGALAECRGREPLPFVALDAGLWRVQLRRDPFSAEHAGVRSLYVRAARERDADVLQALASAARSRGADDALARSVQQDPQAHAARFDETASYLLALLDHAVIALPAPASGYPKALLRQAVVRERVRKLALFALGISALLVGLLVAQRGFSAAHQAEQVMAEAGESPRVLARRRVRMTLRVLAAVCSLLLAFSAIAAYMLARGQGP